MNRKPIRRGSIWRYVGGGPGRNELRMIVGGGADQVVTASVNFSFLGRVADFCAAFTPVQDKEEGQNVNA